MTASILATIVVVAILLFFLIWGFHRGFIRILLTTMTLIVTIAVAGVLAPHCTGLIEKSFIGKSVDKTITSYLEEKLNNPLINSMETAQEMVISELPLPQFMKDDISEKNTPEGYVSLKVNDFTEYLRTRLVGIADSLIAYGILMILIYLLLRILLAISKLINKVPVVGGVNRVLGGVFGLVEGLLVIWCICLLIMMLSGTKTGMQAMEVIESNAFLKFLYEKNGILYGVNALFKAFLG